MSTKTLEKSRHLKNFTGKKYESHEIRHGQRQFHSDNSQSKNEQEVNSKESIAKTAAGSVDVKEEKKSVYSNYLSYWLFVTCPFVL